MSGTKTKTSAITICLALALLPVMLLAGCAQTDNSSISETLQETIDAASAQGQAEGQALQEDEEDGTAQGSSGEAISGEAISGDEAAGDAPSILLYRQNEYKWNDDGSEYDIPAIKHRYSYLLLDGDSAKAHAGLAASLKAARDELVSEHEKAWDDDLMSIEDNELLTFDESWRTYLRRADGKYVSFVCEYCAEGLFDDGAYTSYRAHNYYVDSGREIGFSDVVADEDAFYDLITDRIYEDVDEKLRQYYSTEFGTDKKTLKDDLKDCMASGELVWTLDPFGVTCYLAAYNASPFAVSQTIRFAEDKDGKIFSDGFRGSAEAEWIIQIPGYVGSHIDLNDSGVPEFVSADEFYDYYEGSDEMYLSGLHMGCAGDWQNVPVTMTGGTDYYNIFLVHRNGSTILFEAHDEYDSSFMNTYILSNVIKGADSVKGGLEKADPADFDEYGSSYDPVYIPSVNIVDDNGNIKEISGGSR